MTTTVYIDEAFAALDADHNLERIAGGNETEVYRSDDRRFVVKLKHELGGTLPDAVAWARQLRVAAETYVRCLGPRYSIPSYYLIGRGSDGLAHVLVVQPYLPDALPLANVSFRALSPEERRAVAEQLRDIMRRSLDFYRRHGSMPDLYGRTSASPDERRRLNTPRMLLWRLYGFLVRRNLLRSHNLLLQRSPELRVVLVDYDPVRQSRLYRRLYYAARWMLALRDNLLIARVAGPTR